MCEQETRKADECSGRTCGRNIAHHGPRLSSGGCSALQSFLLSAAPVAGTTMFHLVAQGSSPRQRWRQQLDGERTYLLGRSIDCDCPVPWESTLSRRHCQLRLVGESLEVRRLEQALNPVYFHGEEATLCRVAPGQQFVIGQTSFLLQETNAETPSPTDQPFQEFLFTPQELRQVLLRVYRSQKKDD